jgi:DNA-binding NarL/FixJ family response regulator
LRDALALLDELGAAPAAPSARAAARARRAWRPARAQQLHAQRPLGLTAREREVLNLLALHISNRAIADRLHRSERTVENHVAALLGKLGVASRADAAALARTREK